MRKTSLVLLAGLTGLAAMPAEAQTSRRHHQEARRYEQRPAQQAVPRRYQRAPAPAAPSQGPFPIIHWNTPNADGNFGGPGAGGAGPGA